MHALGMAVILWAATITGPIVIDPSMAGGSEALVSGTRQVTFERGEGGITVHVREGERLDTVTISREGTKLSIGHRDNGQPRPSLGIDRPHVFVDGIDLEPFLTGDEAEASPRPSKGTITGKTTRRYTCPVDHTTLTVPLAPADAVFKCPVDGAIMQPAVGPSQQYWLLH